MQYEIFTIPVFNPEEGIEKLNRFLRGHKVVQVDKEIVRMGEQTYWSFCVNYLLTTSPVEPEKKEKIDYKNVLGQEQFKVFSKLRSCRKIISDKEGYPAYSVFTDAELALLSQMENLTHESMVKIEGIGKKRMERFGVVLLELYNKDNNQE